MNEANNSKFYSEKDFRYESIDLTWDQLFIISKSIIRSIISSDSTHEFVIIFHLFAPWVKSISEIFL